MDFWLTFCAKELDMAKGEYKNELKFFEENKLEEKIKYYAR